MTRPTGTQTGDVLIASIVNAGTTSGGTPAAVTTVPAGWTLVKPAVVSGGTQTSVYTRTAAAADPTSWTFTFAATVKSAGAITAYSGAAAVPVDVSATLSNPSGTTATAPTVTTTGTNRTVVAIYGFSTNTLTAAVTAPIVKRLDKPASASAPTVALTVVDRPVGPGATGTTVVTAVTAARSAAVTIALTPATVAGTVSQTTSNVYDIDRQRILRKDPDGAVTLYLGGHMELRKPAGNGAEATTTYYSIAGTTVAVRTPSTLDWLLGDEHASASTTIDANTGTVRRQYYTPYGDNRATTTNGTTGGNLPTNHNYLNQTRDTTTGLNYLNNRYLDSSTGTFLSVDPLVAKTGQAYLYAGGNPTTYSDPTGLEPNGGSQSCQVHSKYCKTAPPPQEPPGPRKAPSSPARRGCDCDRQAFDPNSIRSFDDLAVAIDLGYVERVKVPTSPLNMYLRLAGSFSMLDRQDRPSVVSDLSEMISTDLGGALPFDIGSTIGSEELRLLAFSGEATHGRLTGIDKFEDHHSLHLSAFVVERRFTSGINLGVNAASDDPTAQFELSLGTSTYSTYEVYGFDEGPPREEMFRAETFASIVVRAS